MSQMETVSRSKVQGRENVRRITNVAALTAVAVILTFVRFPLFQPYLIYEPSDVPVLVISFMYGPLAGVLSSLVVAVLMEVTSGLGGPFGVFMHFLATGTLAVAAGSAYLRMHTRKGAIIALAAGTLTMTIVMAAANVFLTPVFYGIPRDVVMELLLPAIVPFNLVKAGLNSFITFLLYKKISRFVRGKTT